MSIEHALERPRLPRARRFTLHLLVRVRPLGDETWSRGVSVNLSRSGVLLATVDSRLAAGTDVEFCLDLQSGSCAGVGVWRCWGRAVRVLSLDGVGTRLVVLTIDRQRPEGPRSDRRARNVTTNPR